MSTKTTIRRRIAASKLLEHGYKETQVTEILNVIFSEEEDVDSPFERANRRLDLMKHIHHPESYYQEALKSKGIDHTNLTHAEISTLVATCKVIEADIMIQVALDLPRTEITDEMIGKVTNEGVLHSHKK